MILCRANLCVSIKLLFSILLSSDSKIILSNKNI